MLNHTRHRGIYEQIIDTSKDIEVSMSKQIAFAILNHTYLSCSIYVYVPAIPTSKEVEFVILNHTYLSHRTGERKAIREMAFAGGNV